MAGQTETFATGAGRAADLTAENYRFLQEHLYNASGIILEPDRNHLLEVRLLPLLREQKLVSLNDLCALLRATRDPVVSRHVVEAMTTNETLFFRDAHPFQALKSELLPSLVELHKDTRKLAFWSAACATGQEAYSLSMLLLEMGLADWNIQILGTDLNQQVVEKARAARYSQLEVNRGLPAQYLVKYFTRQGQDWELKPEVKRFTKFETFDLRSGMAHLGPFDFVFCRNVLIYFDVPTKKKILEGIRGTLFRGGHLLLGSAETTIHLDDRFRPRSIGSSVFYQAP